MSSGLVVSDCLLHASTGRPEAGVGFTRLLRLLDEDLLAYQSDLTRLVLRPEVSRRAALLLDDLSVARSRHAQARRHANAAARCPGPGPQTWQTVQQATAALAEGRYAIARAHAQLEDGAPPERSAACLFNPAHGWDIDWVEWSPAGETPRKVPACAMDADRLARGLAPAARTVPLDRRRPYWEASGPGYVAWISGWWEPHGPLLPPLLEGTPLGKHLTASPDWPAEKGDGTR